ncbi:ABC transporter permease subunit/CPBP intramembrane protease [candidate division CSSED10-310 bacterium]|uniref:ABC transporter permease subunit/CPBP intramembrane protease n=1 Tax=candidate division CSSED10-310 bacterium TaxID=2855610 RepID=A0ABV6YXU3_UNCC1
MNKQWAEVWLIFTRELQDLLKDKVIILLAVILPIAIYPLILGGISKLVNVQIKKLAAKEVLVFITGDSDWFRPYLNESKDLITVVTAVNDPLQALHKGEIHLWLDFLAVDQNDPGLVIINYTAANELSRRSVQLVTALLEQCRLQEFNQRFARAGLKVEIQDLTLTELIDISTDREKSGYLAGKIVPVMMILMILSGASFAAVDLISGEKERGTLETLLLAPVRRQSIIQGKFLVVFIIACISAAINLLGIYLTLALHVIEIPLLEDVSFNLGFSEVLLILLFTIPMSVIFSALLMIVASYADTFKEGQYYVLPFVLVSIIPAVPALLPNIELNSIICITPIASLAVAIKEVLMGIYHWPGLILTLVSNVFYAYLSLCIAARILDRETILAGTKRGGYSHQPGLVKEGLALFAIVLFLFYFIGSLMQKDDVIVGLWLSEVLIIALPAVVFLRIYRLPSVAFLKIKGFKASQMLGAFFLEGATFLSVFWFMILQDKFLPVPKSFAEQFSSALLNTGYPLWVNIVTIGLSAGICEELLFRGTLTGVFSQSLSRWKVILLVGLLFGLVHLNIYRLFTTAIIGVVYTYIRLQTDSILPTIILHSIHNMAGVYLMSQGAGNFQNVEQYIFTLPGFMAVFVLFFLGWILLRSGPKKEQKRKG